MQRTTRPGVAISNHREECSKEKFPLSPQPLQELLLDNHGRRKEHWNIVSGVANPVRVPDVPS